MDEHESPLGSRSGSGSGDQRKTAEKENKQSKVQTQAPTIRLSVCKVKRKVSETEETDDESNPDSTSFTNLDRESRVSLVF